MKDEIKEMNFSEMLFNRDERLLDYITNLQKKVDGLQEERTYLFNKLSTENKYLYKEIVDNLTTMTVCGDKKQIKNTAQYKLDIYKSRNEKAIEYIRNNIADIEFIKKQYKVVIDDYVETTINDIENLLNILQGSDKDD